MEGEKDETSVSCGWADRWQFRSMDVDQHAARAPHHYICACDYVGCADDLCNGILRKNKEQGPVNPESILI